MQSVYILGGILIVSLTCNAIQFKYSQVIVNLRANELVNLLEAKGIIKKMLDDLIQNGVDKMLVENRSFEEVNPKIQQVINHSQLEVMKTVKEAILHSKN